MWEPDESSGGLVLVGHGGTLAGGHKLSPFVVEVAVHYVLAGLTVAAIDMPGAGDRPDAEEAAKRREGMTIEQAKVELWNDQAIDETIADWQAAIDVLLDEGLGTAGIGYTGVSGGTMFGLPLVAAEPRIGAAVLGCCGAEPRLVRDAPNVTCPVIYLHNLADPLVTADAALALFDVLGSDDKRVHAHPGGHAELPGDELDDCARFLADRLQG